MIRLSDKLTFTAPVSILPGTEPSDDITITFRVLTGKTLTKWSRDAGMAGGNRFTRWLWRLYVTLRRKRTADFLDVVIESWDGVLDEADNPVPYSKESLDKLLRMYRMAGLAIFQTYLVERGKGLQKN